MAAAKTNPLQLSVLLAIVLIAPIIGAAIGYLSPQKTRKQARELLHTALNIQDTEKRSHGSAKKQGDFLRITNASGDIVCADGEQHEIPCWRMHMEQGLLSEVPDTYSPSAPEQLYGIIKERTGPNGTITTLTKKHDLLEPKRPRPKHSTGSRLSSAQKALSH